MQTYFITELPVQQYPEDESFVMQNVQILDVTFDGFNWTMTVGNLYNPLSQTLFIINESETLISHYMNKSRYELYDLKPGMMVNVTYGPIMSKSIPFQATALHIEILGIN